MRSIFWMTLVLAGLACGEVPVKTPSTGGGSGAGDARGIHDLSKSEISESLGAQPGMDPNAKRKEVPAAKASTATRSPDASALATPELPDPPCVLQQPAPSPELLDPTQWTEQAPPTYQVTLETTAGNIVLAVTRAWAPMGADRFYNLVKSGYLTDIAWFRVVPGFVAQGGMHGDPKVNDAWKDATIQDDPVVESNARGTVTFATSGKNSRSNQFFINFKKNSNLDGMGFAPFAKVVEGMDVVDSIYKGHREKPNQGQIAMQGSAYLCKQFPELDRIIRARFVD